MFKSIETLRLDKIKRKTIEFYLKDFLPMPKHTVGMLASRGGMGKTFLSLRVAAEFVKETNKKVLVWFSEDEPEIIAFRFDKLVKSFGVDENTQNKIHYITTPPKQFAIKDKGVFKANYEEVMELRKDCVKNDIGLLVIDPLLAFYGGDENDNSQARVFMQVFLQWAKEDGINILFVHHGKKDSGEVRGATAFVDATRFVYELHYPMNGNNVDFDKKDLGYREIRLTKDNHNVFYHFNKIYADGVAEIKILPNAKETEIQYQDKNGRYTGTPKPISETEYVMDEPIENPLERQGITISIANHNDQFNPKGFKKTVVAWDELIDVMTMGCAYSPSVFKDDYRTSKNYLGGNDVVFLDIDDGMTINQAMKAFSSLQALIVTTKSHQKEKNGKPAVDRFRVVLKLKEPINLNQDEYRVAMQSIFDYFGSVADKSTKDPARFFFASPLSCEVFDTKGTELFDWKDVYTQAKRLRMIEDQQRVYHAQNVSFEGSTLEDASEALNFIEPDCDYEQWVSIGMALSAEYGDSAFNLWDNWSRKGSKYSEREMQNKWKSFKGKGVGIGTLFHYAKENGYFRQHQKAPSNATSYNDNMQMAVL